MQRDATHGDPGPMPIPLDVHIEGGSGADPDPGSGDRHGWEEALDQLRELRVRGSDYMCWRQAR